MLKLRGFLLANQAFSPANYNGSQLKSQVLG